MNNTITLKNIKKTFVQGQEELTVLKSINISFSKNISYALTGASGTGKSTLLQLMAGLQPPTSGTISINGRDISTLSTLQHRKLLHTSIGLVFQSPFIIKELTLFENVILKLLINRPPSDEDKDRAYRLLTKVNLFNKAHKSCYTLSGGELQRVAMVRALFNNPDFLLADEPTAHLDNTTKDLIIHLLLSHKEETNMGIIITSHDNSVFQQMQSILQLHNGNLLDHHVSKTND
jgi:lipoprotein-releasing system ATP-binding protein